MKSRHKLSSEYLADVAVICNTLISTYILGMMYIYDSNCRQVEKGDWDFWISDLVKIPDQADL